MIDVREQVLVRLLEVITGLPGIRNAYRNNGDLDKTQLPAAIVFDGDEEALNGDTLAKHPPGTYAIMQMTPEIVIAEQTVGQVGAALAPLRRELIKRVLFDAQLQQIVKADSTRSSVGTIYCLGHQTDIGWMRSLHGALRARFVFKYTLKPHDL